MAGHVQLAAAAAATTSFAFLQCAHIMAMAVQRLHKDAQVTIGPWIDRGFYYDFDLPTPLSDKELKVRGACGCGCVGVHTATLEKGGGVGGGEGGALGVGWGAPRWPKGVWLLL
jgi:hypothetical protein